MENSTWKQIDAKVYPSEENTISVVDDEIYGGAHIYTAKDCMGFNEGKTQYRSNVHLIRFVQKNDDGSIIPGLQSEQLVLICLDRAKKLNARFPSEHNEKQIKSLEMFLEGCADRVKERIERGVMGELKK